MTIKKSLQNVNTQDSKSIRVLYDYWRGVSNEIKFSSQEFSKFLKMNKRSVMLFQKYFPYVKNKFIESAYILSWSSVTDSIPNSPNQTSLSDKHTMLLRDFGNKHTILIKKYFYLSLKRSHTNQSILKDCETIIDLGDKLSYKWAAGIVASNYISEILIRVHKKEKIKFKCDDILSLQNNLISHSKNDKLKKFLNKNHLRFKDADKTRNRCAHVNEGEPTRIEIEQLIAFANLLHREMKVIL